MTKSELVVQEIRRMVMQGELRPGDRAVVGHIAKRLKVSDTPVREAIKQLVSDGFLEESPHIGAIVPVFTIDEVKETFYMRGALAALGVRLNADNYTDEVMQRIRAILDQGEQSVKAGDALDYATANTLFHVNLFNTGHFRNLHNTYLGLMRQVDRYRAGFRDHQWNIAESHAMHIEIWEALVARDFEMAAVLIERHEVSSMQPLIDYLRVEESRAQMNETDSQS